MLKKAILLGALLVPVNARAQRVEVRVDSRIELFSILFHLAGRDEYNMTGIPQWTSAIASHFAPYKTHAAMQTTTTLATARRVGFFIPINLAVHFGQPPQLEDRAPAGGTTSLHRTWSTFPDSTRAYVATVRLFAADVDYAGFLRAQSAVIDSAQQRMRRLLPLVDQTWLNRFWGGAPKSDLYLVPGLTTGRASYGVEFTPVSGTAEAYAIIGVTKVDAAGLPAFDTSTVSTILHEMNHPYVTPLVRQHLAQFAGFGDSLYARVAQKMRAQYYGTWDAVLNESLVRAAVVQYLASNGRAIDAEQTTMAEIAAGFIWTRELAALLAEYDRSRSTYPAFADFMPRIVSFFREYLSRAS